MELGAQAFVDFSTSKDVFEELKKVTGGLGPHAAIITSGDEWPFAHFSEYIRSHGTVVAIGIPTHGYLKSQMQDFCQKEATLRSTIVGNRFDLAEALEFYRRGLIKVPTQIVPMSKLHETLDLLDHSKVVGRYIVDPSK
jgi:alcohol dehydrogenase, propanol-preferring